MLLATSDLLGLPLMSLQTGGDIAYTTAAIINPHNLHILAYELDGAKLDEHPSFIRIEDIRELSDLGFIIDSSDELTILDDIVIDKSFYEEPIQLEGMKVVDEHGTKLGKVERTITATDTFSIEQLNVRQPFFKSLADTELLIGRRQIIDIDKDTITVRSASVKDKPVKKLEKQPFVNPFRSASPPQPESIKTDRR